MAKKRQFKTESKKLLNLMIHSIYTHKEIFLRELISNASDAIDKRHFLSLTDENVSSAEYEILIKTDKENKTISIEDNGIGFTEDELIQNLGTIAESGSKAFLEKADDKGLDIIGQFGVGFYSAFMVAKKVVVETKSPFSEKAYMWSSDGESSYEITETDKNAIGTKITLHLRADNEELEENYSEFLETYKIRSLVKKYSDYVRYPILMEVENDKKELEKETLNQMTPIWQRSKQDIKDEDLNQFYKHQFNDYETPLKVIHTKVEGLLTYTAMLFIPKKPAYDFYQETYEKGLQLYSKGVFIQEKNKDLIPDYFKFVKGLVDSPDLTLNISREILQHDRQLKKIANHIESKIISEFKNMQKNERELYDEFYETYKNTLKYGIYEFFGANKDKLIDLIMFKTSKSDKYVTLKEYIESNPADQDAIYYASGKTKEQILNLPQMDLMKEKNLEVLLFTDEIDEFMIQIIGNYEEISFKSVQKASTDLLDDTKKDELKKEEKTHKKILSALKDALKDKVKDVKLTYRLKEAPVCLVSGDELSLEMEKVLKQLPDAKGVKAELTLEVNPDHPLFKKINEKYTQNKEDIYNYAIILYYQALMLEGYPIEDPTNFLTSLNDLMLK